MSEEKKAAEEKVVAKYMDDRVAHYEAILTGLASDDTPARTGRQEIARLTQVSQTKR